MPAELFDMTARALRRDRAFRSGPVLFLYERAFADIVERLADINRSFASALLIGTPDPSFPERLAKVAGQRDRGRSWGGVRKGSRCKGGFGGKRSISSPQASICASLLGLWIRSTICPEFFSGFASCSRRIRC
jgi:hypothetical protein